MSSSKVSRVRMGLRAVVAVVWPLAVVVAAPRARRPRHGHRLRCRIRVGRRHSSWRIAGRSRHHGQRRDVRRGPQRRREVRRSRRVRWTGLGGIVLSSGQVHDVIGPNTSDTGGDLGQPGDRQLDALPPSARRHRTPPALPSTSRPPTPSWPSTTSSHRRSTRSMSAPSSTMSSPST